VPLILDEAVNFAPDDLSPLFLNRIPEYQNPYTSQQTVSFQYPANSIFLSAERGRTSNPNTVS
jgi:hypothetical protein